MVAAVPTVVVVPAAAYEVSASIAHLLSDYGQEYQKLAGEAAAFHEQFVQPLTGSADSYAGAEAANIAQLQPSTETANSLASAATPIPTSLEEFGSLVVNRILLATIGIFVVLPLLLAFVGLTILFPSFGRGVVALMNGRG